MGKPAGFLVVPVGYNPSGRLRALELDASDRLIVNDDQLKTILDKLSFDGSDRLIVTDDQLKTILDKLTFDASNYLKVVEQGAAGETANSHGYISGAWQKNPMMAGFSDAISVVVQDTSLTAGAGYLGCAAVPAGEFHLVSSVNVRHNGASVTRLSMIANVGGQRIYLWDLYAPVIGRWYLVTGQFLLGPGDYIEFKFEGVTLNDDLYGRYIGSRIDVDL